MNLRGLPRYFQLVKTCHHSCSVPNWLTHKTWICTPLFTGKSKANLGWTPLHLGAYFGHSEVVRALLEVSLVRNNFWPLYNSHFWFLECLVDFPTEIFLTILLPVYVFHKLKYLNCYHKKISNIFIIICHLMTFLVSFVAWSRCECEKWNGRYTTSQSGIHWKSSEYWQISMH